ncbi:HAD family hydrolase [Olsenella sp. YH-ols2217]|uniref:HAD family hydrolase n=1 Tax=Kribbibacterium absianum TaxID=3044210 RepID=A0ABT6ZID3_9ACTN|nr:HAD family hydrolase [Olsenella sp. YH-ols2217]MDJ1128574.1 HAD family hydrolase [Olsenella sp. YH-ols2217]
MIRLVLTDLDNTLVNTPVSPRLTPFARHAIHRLQKAGVRFGPATGRMPWMLDPIFGDERDLWATSVQGNGQVGYLDGEKVFEHEVDWRTLRRLGEFLKDKPGAVLYAIDETDTLAVGGLTQEELNGQYDIAFRGPVVVDEVPERRWVKANVHCFRAPGAPDFQQLRVQMEALCPDLDFVSPTPEPILWDITNKGRSKASGIRELLGVMGLEEDEVAVFGDSDNDIEMLAAFPYSVAVANAKPGVLEAANYAVGSVEEDGAARAFLEIAEASARGALPAFLM